MENKGRVWRWLDIVCVHCEEPSIATRWGSVWRCDYFKVIGSESPTKENCLVSHAPYLRQGRQRNNVVSPTHKLLSVLPLFLYKIFFCHLRCSCYVWFLSRSATSYAVFKIQLEYLYRCYGPCAIGQAVGWIRSCDSGARAGRCLIGHSWIELLHTWDLSLNIPQDSCHLTWV